jgi:hypothetical protein
MMFCSLFVVLWFYRSAFCHPIGAKLGSMKLKVAWEESLSTGFFKIVQESFRAMIPREKTGAGLHLVTEVRGYPNLPPRLNLNLLLSPTLCRAKSAENSAFVP